MGVAGAEPSLERAPQGFVEPVCRAGVGHLAADSAQLDCRGLGVTVPDQGLREPRGRGMVAPLPHPDWRRVCFVCDAAPDGEPSVCGLSGTPRRAACGIGGDRPAARYG